MRAYIQRLAVFTSICSMVFPVITYGPAWASMTQGREQAPPAAPVNGVKQPATERKMAGPSGHHRLKAHKKVVPKAVIRKQSPLPSHGMMEDFQRYDPRPNHRAGVVQDPQAPELAHDHFQELDRNQDGRVDPVERAFGRLDMDRDLPTIHR